MQDASGLHRAGLAHLARREKEEALACFDAALRDDPSHAESQVERAYLVFETRDWGRALTEMQRAQALAHARLAEASPERGRYWDDAAGRILVRAVHGVGLCRMKMGQRSEAEEAFGRVLEMAPSDPVGARFMLADLR